MPQPQAATMPALWPGVWHHNGASWVPPGALSSLLVQPPPEQWPLSILPGAFSWRGERERLGRVGARGNLLPDHPFCRSIILTLSRLRLAHDPLTQRDRSHRPEDAARNGVAVIWQLQVAAGIAYRTGYPGPAASIMEVLIASATSLRGKAISMIEAAGPG